MIFGGLGDDVIDGQAGDDAISGAEALDFGYAADSGAGGVFNVVRSDYSRPYNPGGLLHYGLHSADATINGFAMFDESRPHQRVTIGGIDFFMNFDALNGPKSPVIASDGDDLISGGIGNDWLTGGTGRDSLSGGEGDDVLNADDDLTTGGGANLTVDPDPSYADVAARRQRARPLPHQQRRRPGARSRRRRHGDAAARSGQLAARLGAADRRCSGPRGLDHHYVGQQRRRCSRRSTRARG